MGAARGPSTGGEALALVLSCEHGGNDVPRAFRRHFEPPPSVLASRCISRIKMSMPNSSMMWLERPWLLLRPLTKGLVQRALARKQLPK